MSDALLDRIEAALGELLKYERNGKPQDLREWAQSLAAITEAPLRRALLPFVKAYRKTADPIPDSDLDNEQPRSVTVTLGDCRYASQQIPHS